MTDIILSWLLWILVPTVLLTITLFIGPWMLASADMCRADPPCDANPTLGVVMMLGGSLMAAAAGIALSILFGKRRWPLLPVAVLGNVGIITAWMFGFGIVVG
ncbi:hypothetical protein ACFC06_17700 [Nocardia sp. NPDC056064]|uniref:hypothetical protein n=1 Tax=Nocardia sp. NPDC056064 TaxID=3345701 RepID=UPI0035E1D4A4